MLLLDICNKKKPFNGDADGDVDWAGLADEAQLGKKKRLLRILILLTMALMIDGYHGKDNGYNEII